MIGDWPVKRDPVFGCWLWTGRKDRNGYGVTKSGRMAHRVVYESEAGPIVRGLEPDHLCRRRPCVAPHHLELVSRSEQERRKSWRYRVRHVKRCPRGHGITGPICTPEGGRLCRICAKEQDA